MFSPPPPPPPAPQKALPVEHAVMCDRSCQEFNIAAPCMWRYLFSTPPGIKILQLALSLN